MAQTHSTSGEVIRLQALGVAIPASRTTALLKARQLELVRLVLPAGTTMREHSTAGEVTVLCLEGAIDLTTPNGPQRMAAGDLIHLAAGEPHALRGVSDATALVTICLAGP
jgi:quercetin dioxygenase-like cupin family protein